MAGGWELGDAAPVLPHKHEKTPPFGRGSFDYRNGLITGDDMHSLARLFLLFLTVGESSNFDPFTRNLKEFLPGRTAIVQPMLIPSCHEK
jgi:hypothetical protein